jgi:hypothetical protein
MQKFILLYQGAESRDGFRLIGPFPSDEELKAWGEHWQMENDDDPRWHVIGLPEFEGSFYPLHVTAPERLSSTFLEDRVAKLKAQLRGYKELRRLVRQRERGRVEREGQPVLT